MATARKQTRVVIAPGRVRYKIRIENEECPKGTREAEVRQYLLIEWMHNNYELLTCGLARFETLKIYHDGTCWIIEAEAETDENTDQQS